MTLQASGAISINDLIAEFGGGNDLFDFYRGGALVPDTATNAGVPTSGPISLFDFYGASAVSGVIQVTSPVQSMQSVSGGNVHAGVQFQTDGGLDKIGPALGGLTPHNPGEYWSAEPDAGIGANYDVRCASISSGSWTSAAAATGTWVNMATARIWRVFVSSMASPTSNSCTAVFEIRPAGGGAVLDSFTVTCSASN